MGKTINAKTTIADVVRTVLRAAGGAEGLLATSLLLMPISEKHWSTFSLEGKRAEEAALAFFRNKGFRASRSHLNFERGYNGLLWELWTPPPWIWVEGDDVFDIPADQLFTQLKRFGAAHLINTYRKYLQNTLPKDLVNRYFTGGSSIDDELHWSPFNSFHLSLDLASCLSEAEFDALTGAVIDLDLHYVRPGAPDLLIWDAAEKLWFLAEVKGPGDKIRESQRKWLRSNWDQVRSNFLFVSLDVCA